MSFIDHFTSGKKGIPRVLSIAGSDSGGGAGIQADIKTFSALSTYGMSAITAVTAQNTKDVLQIMEMSQEMVYKQIQAVAEDVGVDAFKTGMLSSRPIIEVVIKAIADFQLKNFVCDPVMLTKSGVKLLADDAINILIHELIPLADVITPNIPEAEVITKQSIDTEATIRVAAEKIMNMGAKCVVIKGGHLQGDPVDWVCSQKHFFALPERRINTPHTHGSGCTYSSAIAAFLARGYETDRAIREAKKYIHKAISFSLSLGNGHGPLHHFHSWYKY